MGGTVIFFLGQTHQLLSEIFACAILNTWCMRIKWQQYFSFLVGWDNWSLLAISIFIGRLSRFGIDFFSDVISHYQERMAMRKAARNSKTSGIAQRQQLYQTIDAIDQITNNLSTRLQKLTLQSQEISMNTLNISRRPHLNESRWVVVCSEKLAFCPKETPLGSLDLLMSPVSYMSGTVVAEIINGRFFWETKFCGNYLRNGLF